MQLVVQSGAEPGRTYDLNVGNRLSVGRQSSNEIVVSDEQVSRKHAHIELKSAGVIVTDLSSSNGTFVNGTRISSVITLKPGDTLQVGTTVLKLVDNQSATATAVLPANFEPSTATLPAFEYGASSAGSGIGGSSARPAPPSPPASSGTGSRGSGYDSPSPAPAYGYNPAPPAPAQPSPPAYGQSDPVVPPPAQPSIGQAPAYGQSQPSAYGQPQPSAYGQSQPSAYGQSQPEASYPPPQQAAPAAYGQPAYGQSTQVSGYPQQAAYAQPQPGTSGGRKINPLLFVVLVAATALVLIGGGLFFFLGGSDLPAPNNSTKIEISSADQAEITKNQKDNAKYNFYTSKDSLSDLKSFYSDKMKGKGYTLDKRSSSTSTMEQLVFVNGDKAALVLLLKLDQSTITVLETSAASFKGKLKEGDTLVGLTEGKASSLP
jgi:hypothetical protein